MIERVTLNGRISTWHRQLDGTLIAPERCCCLDNAHPELECPIDDHRVRWLQQHDEGGPFGSPSPDAPGGAA